MSRATPDDQLKFLLSCVRHSNAGKIDFVEVARECGVVSKGAAAKRYERLLKTNGIHPNGGATEKPTTVSKQKTRAEIAKSALAKKRKIEGDDFEARDDDEDDYGPNVKTEDTEMTQIKPELDTGFSWDSHQHLGRPPPSPFFPRAPPPPPMMMQNPFTQPYPSMKQPHQHPGQFPASPYHLPQLIIRSSPPSQQTPQLSLNLSAPTQQLSIKCEEETPAVPEEHIQTMFDEFCSQDMFKQPNFSVPSVAAATTANHSGIINPAPLHNAISSHASPATIIAAPLITAQTQHAQTDVKKESDTETMLEKVMEEPKGSGFDDCILITD